MRSKRFCPLALFALMMVCGPARADRARPDVTIQAHATAVIDVAFSPDGSRLASVGNDGLVNVWDVAASKQLLSFKEMATNQNQVRFTPDGNALVSRGEGNDICVFDLKARKLRKSIPFAGVSGGARAIDLSPDGKTIAAVGRGTLRFYDTGSGSQKASYEVHPGYNVEAVEYVPDGAAVATTSTDRTATIVDIKTGRTSYTFPTEFNGTCAAFSGDGKSLFVGTSGRVFRAFDLAGGEPQALIELGREIMTVRRSRDGKTLVLGGLDRAPWLVTLPERKVLEVTMDSDDWVKSAELSPDGKWLAGGANGGAIYLWKFNR